MAQVLKSTIDFSTNVDGDEYAVHKGDTLYEDHPLVAKHPELFIPAENKVTFPTPSRKAAPRVEQATARPGQRRNR